MATKIKKGIFMDTESWLHLWIGISVVLALASIVDSYLWYKVIGKIMVLHRKIQQLESENEELRKEK